MADWTSPRISVVQRRDQLGGRPAVVGAATISEERGYLREDLIAIQVQEASLDVDYVLGAALLALDEPRDRGRVARDAAEARLRGSLGEWRPGARGQRPSTG